MKISSENTSSIKCPSCGHEFKQKTEILRGENQKRGMERKALEGKSVSRPPFGYLYSNGLLVFSEDSKKVLEIFEEFLKEGVTFASLAKKYGFSINGIKKILSNFSYIGKVKFNGQIHTGNHQAIISSTLFNKVQDKLERIKKEN